MDSYNKHINILKILELLVKNASLILQELMEQFQLEEHHELMKMINLDSFLVMKHQHIISKIMIQKRKLK